GWFLVFWSALFLALTTCFRQTRERLVTALRLHWRPVLGAAGVCVAGLVPFLIVYLPVVRKVGGWPYAEALRFTPEIRSYLLMADGNFVWSRVSGPILQAAGKGQWLGVVDWERRVGSGVVTTLTWLGLSVVALRARTRRPLLAAVILSVNLLVLLALQYHGHS